MSTEGKGAVLTAATSAVGRGIATDGAALQHCVRAAGGDLTFVPADVIVESDRELVAERAVKE